MTYAPDLSIMRSAHSKTWMTLRREETIGPIPFSGVMSRRIVAASTSHRRRCFGFSVLSADTYRARKSSRSESGMAQTPKFGALPYSIDYGSLRHFSGNAGGYFSNVQHIRSKNCASGLMGFILGARSRIHAAQQKHSHEQDDRPQEVLNLCRHHEVPRP